MTSKQGLTSPSTTHQAPFLEDESFQSMYKPETTQEYSNTIKLALMKNKKTLTNQQKTGECRTQPGSVAFYDNGDGSSKFLDLRSPHGAAKC